MEMKMVKRRRGVMMRKSLRRSTKRRWRRMMMISRRGLGVIRSWVMVREVGVHRFRLEQVRQLLSRGRGRMRMRMMRVTYRLRRSYFHVGLATVTSM